MSAMKCSGCGNEGAIVLPVDGGDVESEWRCNRCEARYSAKEMENICEECNDDLFATNSSSVQAYEALLEKISPKLASTHYIVLTVKKYLGDLYGFVKGYRYPELPEEKLLAKIEYLREFVDTISKADPGYPKWKGTALYDLQRAVLFRANSEFNAGTLSKVRLLDKFSTKRMIYMFWLSCQI